MLILRWQVDLHVVFRRAPMTPLKTAGISALCLTMLFFAENCFHLNIETIQKQKCSDAYEKSVIKQKWKKLIIF